MPLSDYESFAEEPLVFPIGGKKYTLPPLGIEEGLLLAGIISGRDKRFAKKSTDELWKLVLGPLWDEMVRDGVPMGAVTRVALAAVAENVYGRETAIKAWETGADPEALAAYLSKEAASTPSTRTGGAKKTPSRASTSGTRPRKK